MFDKTILRLSLAAALLASAATVRAQPINVFNMGGTISGGTWTGLASLQFVTVGNPGNVADSAYNSGMGTSTVPGTGLGAVSYTYMMGEFDVTAAQYAVFLNAVATASDPYGIYCSGMATVGGSTHGCGIVQSGTPGNYSYTVAPACQNFPVNYVTWGDAARFCNWLQNGQPTGGTEGAGTTETGAYTLDGDTTNLLTENRNPGATYFIPSENEFYKAAYYVGGGTNGGYWTYPTKSLNVPINSLVLAPTSNNDANYYDYGYTDPTNDLTPVETFAASPGPYGTYDMGGDVFQWNEAVISGSFRGFRGGSWLLNSHYLASSTRDLNSPTDENGDVGFRVASVPEPGSLALLLAGAVAFGAWRLRHKARRYRASAAVPPPPSAHLTSTLRPTSP
jgi:formylglycine-generating enzyme required for sulfatase activity